MLIELQKANRLLQAALDSSYHGKVKSPVFIVGCGRSGTTLLFDLLSQHPLLARTTGYPDGEDHQGWIDHGHCIMAGIGHVYHPEYHTGINGFHFCLHMTREDVTREVYDGMHKHYWDNVLQRDENKRILNKAPHNSNKIDYMLKIFSDAKIIHIVRDCQPTVLSWLAVMEEHPTLIAYWPEEKYPCFWLMPRPKDDIALARLARHERFYPGGGAEMWIEYWCKTNMSVKEQIGDRHSQLLTVRYEDVVNKPSIVLNRITEFCDLPHYDFNVSHLEKNTANKHLTRLKPELIMAINHKANDVRAQFGYLGSITSENMIPQLFIP